jgi:hypothetical protein
MERLTDMFTLGGGRQSLGNQARASSPTNNADTFAMGGGRQSSGNQARAMSPANNASQQVGQWQYRDGDSLKDEYLIVSRDSQQMKQALPSQVRFTLGETTWGTEGTQA